MRGRRIFEEEILDLVPHWTLSLPMPLELTIS